MFKNEFKRNSQELTGLVKNIAGKEEIMLEKILLEKL
jgi:hypothetical protein